MLHEPYLKVWLRTAYHFDLLDCDRDNRFRLQPHLAEVLGIDPWLDHMDYGIDEAGPSQADEDSPLHRYIRTGTPIDSGKSPQESLATSRATKSVYLLFLSVILERYDHLKQALKQGIRFKGLVNICQHNKNG